MKFRSWPVDLHNPGHDVIDKSRPRKAGPCCGRDVEINPFRHRPVMPQEQSVPTGFLSESQNVLPLLSEVVAFELGFQLAKLRWHLHAAVYSGTLEEEATVKLCVANVRPLLTSLFPEQRGGLAYRIAETFQDT